ncbi:MAG: hypothetical protein B6U75_03455 [Desulfurococcales archaeon ex4484_217_1]|nr:MAG: hypothetical protein B6U75_03455 [Desulfurococcales archaeon ex4484_217_1]
MEIDWLQLISTQGVAVAIAIYLVYWITNKLDRRIEKLTEAINNLTEAVNTLKILVDRGREHDGGE